MTHEETVTFHAREIQSYRQLPQMLYHFSTKDRDEPRPRGGLLRVREFIMKDSYSFDRDEEGLDVSFRKHAGAYDRIFERCGLEVFAVQAESGMMGGSESIDYLAPVRLAARTRSSPASAATTRPTSRSRAASRARPSSRAASTRREEVETPGVTTIEALAEFLGDRRRRDVEGDARRHATTARSCSRLVRGDDRLEEAKLAAVLGSGFRPATEDEIREAFGADPGSLGPVGFAGEIVADETLREGQFVAGANRTGWHLRGVEHGRDFEARFADIRVAPRGRHLPALRRRAALPDGDRGRPHLQARHALLRAARRDVPRRGRARSARS